MQRIFIAIRFSEVLSGARPFSLGEWSARTPDDSGTAEGEREGTAELGCSPDTSRGLHFMSGEEKSIS